jgi:phosphoserine phosphatase
MKKLAFQYLTPYFGKMLEVLLIRHGQTEWNRERKVMGSLPIPLNEHGRQQAETMRGLLQNTELTAFYTSPIQRAVETAHIIRGERDCEVVEASAVGEIDYGEWVGKSFEELIDHEQFKVYFTNPAQSQPPEGETLKDAKARAVSFVDQLRKKHETGRVVVVTHADVIKILVVHYLGLGLNDIHRLRIDNGSMSLLMFDKQLARVLSVNTHGHVESYFGQKTAAHTKIIHEAFAKK